MAQSLDQLVKAFKKAHPQYGQAGTAQIKALANSRKMQGDPTSEAIRAFVRQDNARKMETW